VYPAKPNRTEKLNVNQNTTPIIANFGGRKNGIIKTIIDLRIVHIIAEPYTLIIPVKDGLTLKIRITYTKTNALKNVPINKLPICAIAAFDPVIPILPRPEEPPLPLKKAITTPNNTEKDISNTAGIVFFSFSATSPISDGLNFKPAICLCQKKIKNLIFKRRK